MVHPNTELRWVNDVIGRGVFATEFIPKGTITWVRDDLDQSFTCEQVERMESIYREILEKYTFVDGRGRMVLCWDHARFFNHSCEANCLSAGYDFEIAVRDIFAGEELRDDYGTLNLQTPFPCDCQSPNCRKQILPDDMERWADVWDGLVRCVFPLIPQVAQPLWPLFQEKAEVEAALKDLGNLRSIRCHYLYARQD
ncbi:MAG: SET domain-containing protein [Verrucomicrobia bacterium]|nr:SET domain-containing protein [Verrucomicrobiota bacterium]